MHNRIYIHSSKLADHKLLTELTQLVMIAERKVKRGFRARSSAMVVMISLIMISIVLSPGIPLISPGTTIRNSGTIESMSPLHVEERYIKDSHNRIVYLRGVNKGWVDDYTGNWVPVGKNLGPNGVWNPQAVADNLQVMSNVWGCNVVRFTISPYYWKFDNSTMHFRQNIKDTAEIAADLGMYIILTGYQVLPYSMGALQDALPYPPFQDGSNPNGTNQLALATIGSKSDFVMWWADVANELKEYPNIIFELWNEPHAGNLIDWTKVVQETINGIRSTGSSNLIIVQWWYDVWHNQGGFITLQWVEDMNLNGSNIVYSTHTYVENMDGADHTTKDYISLQMAYQNCLVDWVGNTLKKPLIIGETGTNTWLTEADWINEVKAFTTQLAIFSDWQIGYLAWTWTATGKHPLLQKEPYIPPPSMSGQVLIDSINGISPPPSSQSMGSLHVRTYREDMYIVAMINITGVGTFSTPFKIDLDEGSYILEVTFGNHTFSQVANVVINKTTSLDFQFAS